MPSTRSRSSLGLLSAAAFAISPSAGLAVDGVIEINQARALAGGVTPSDGAGFPVTLDASGSYRLTGPLVVPDGTTTAILLAADYVSIDLNGFSISCADPCTGSTGKGIDGSDDRGVTVRNGTIIGMGGRGIEVRRNSSVENVALVGNGGEGLYSFDNVHVRGCHVRDNMGDGIRVSDRSVVEGNTSAENSGRGIFAEFGSVISNNVSNDNTGAGIRCAADCTIAGNSVVRNGEGISGSATVTGNTVTQSVGVGLILGAFSGYGGNVINGNDSGGGNVQVSGGLEIGINVCGGNTSCP